MPTRLPLGITAVGLPSASLVPSQPRVNVALEQAIHMREVIVRARSEKIDATMTPVVRHRESNAPSASGGHCPAGSRVGNHVWVWQ